MSVNNSTTATAQVTITEEERTEWRDTFTEVS